MTETHSFLEEPADTREIIMKATYHALCEHGYADLTIQRIGDHFEKSKSLLYHHYDSKDELLLDFLEFMLEHYKANIPRTDYDDAHAHLQALLDHVFPDELEAERRKFMAAMVELRAQAAHDDAYREHFTRSDSFFHDRIAEIVRMGIKEGVFRDIDPDRTAALLVTTITGAMTRRTTADGDVAIPAVRRELQQYIESQLLTEVSQ
ncbi:TetR/AcrR family transcriptional regulator [Haladaptatus halobius]|uniref:TetR/AcrR family transcriptional regulator n=1 Tax=Haladaptatus halobius TaxID=2884875 RepID=UPI001D09FD4F|nr:TetR/AcrR family transcriptional regulator [Haladaptatus halobius]